MILAPVTCVFGLLVGALSPAWGQQPLTVLWLKDSSSLNDDDRYLIERITDETGVQIDVKVIFSPAPGWDDYGLFQAVKEAWSGNAGLIFGLSKQQVLFLGREIRTLREWSSSQADISSLAVHADHAKSFEQSAGVWGVPIEVSLPIVCVQAGSFLHKEYDSVQMESMAYGFGNEYQRISVSDPRSDSVGFTVLLTAFLEGKGTRGGWEITDSIDRFVESYPSSHQQTCEAVANGHADIGITMLANQDSLKSKYSTIEFMALDRAMYVPVKFASPLVTDSESEADVVLDWLATRGLRRSAALLLTDANLDLSYRIDEYDSKLAHFPVQDVLNDWSTRYGFKAGE